MIPPIYYINLDRCTSRDATMQRQLKEFRLEAYRCTAIDGSQRSNLEQVMDIPECVQSLPELACTASHILAIQRALQDGHECAIISEDDVELRFFSEHMEEFCAIMERAPDYDVIQLVVSNANVTSQYMDLYAGKQYFAEWNPKCYCTGAYVISREGMKKIVDSNIKNGCIVFPELPHYVADIVLYYSGRTYCMTRQFIAYLLQESTIHTVHRDMHVAGLDQIKRNQSLACSVEVDRQEEKEVEAFIVCSNKDSLTNELDTVGKQIGNLRIRLFIVMNGVSKKLEPILKKMVNRWKKHQVHVDIACIVYRKKKDPESSDLIPGKCVEQMISVKDNMTADAFIPTRQENTRIYGFSQIEPTIVHSAMSTVLYVFITHQAELEMTKQRVSKMMQGRNYLIAVGGFDKTFQQDRILYLQCNDRYEGLPEKVIKMYQFIVTSTSYNGISHVIKMDSDMKFFSDIPRETLDMIVYGGRVESRLGNRSWHIGRCSKGSRFNTRPYDGEYVPWCLGGCGYVLNRKALLILADATGYKDQIYEDLYVAKILRKHGVAPKSIDQMDRYFKSPAH